MNELDKVQTYVFKIIFVLLENLNFILRQVEPRALSALSPDPQFPERLGLVALLFHLIIPKGFFQPE